MSTWRNIMDAAEAAKAVMVSDRGAGEKKFDLLLREHPQDGMIYFKRGLAYEALKQNSLATRDFERAFELFPMPEWKAHATYALERARRDSRSRNEKYNADSRS